MTRFEYRSQKKNTARSKQMLSVLLFMVIFLIFLFGLLKLSGGNTTRQKSTLDRAIQRTITSCYAVEGAYPESLDYMKDFYGLTYNEDLFFVDYRVPGVNIRPTYIIIEKGEGK